MRQKKTVTILVFVNWHHFQSLLCQNNADPQKQKSPTGSKRVNFASLQNHDGSCLVLAWSDSTSIAKREAPYSGSRMKGELHSAKIHVQPKVYWLSCTWRTASNELPYCLVLPLPGTASGSTLPRQCFTIQTLSFSRKWDYPTQHKTISHHHQHGNNKKTQVR